MRDSSVAIAGAMGNGGARDELRNLQGRGQYKGLLSEQEFSSRLKTDPEVSMKTMVGAVCV